MLPDYDDDIPADTPLLSTVNLLLPLRERKLFRLTRVLREEKQTLKALEQDLNAGEKRLARFRLTYKDALDDFNKHHTGVILLHEKLHQALEEERGARTRLLKQEEDNQGLTERIVKQRDVISEAQENIETCQREIEKLEYILEQKELM